jgi:hypothetical protein
MDNQFPTGMYVRGYIASDDLRTATPIPLFDADGISVSPANYLTRRMIIDNLLLANGGTSSVITVFADTDGNGSLASGEELVSVSLPANGQVVFPVAGALASRKFAASNVNTLYVVQSVASAATRITLVGRIINS